MRDRYYDEKLGGSRWSFSWLGQKVKGRPKFVKLCPFYGAHSFVPCHLAHLRMFLFNSGSKSVAFLCF